MSWNPDAYENRTFRDQPIPPRSRAPQSRLPERLRQAKALAAELRANRRSREEVFLAQGELLADWEPEEVTLPGDGRPRYKVYYVTYESLNDRELEGYFVWRTGVRNHDIQGGPGSYVFLYLYELVNGIGVSDPAAGYRRLQEIAAWEELEPSVRYYLNRWMTEYLVWYDLPPAPPEESTRLTQLKQIEAVFHGPAEARMAAVTELSAYRLDRSRFYRTAKPLFDRVALAVLDRVREHYEKRRKCSIEQDFFGAVHYSGPVRLFDAALFLPRTRPADRTYTLDPMTVYRCKNGRWTVERVTAFAERSDKLGKLMKTVDCALRVALSDPHPLKPVSSAKWVLQIVEEEIARAQAEERRKPVFDLSQLSRIRSEAAETRDKLLTESEQDTPEPRPAYKPVEPPAPSFPAPDTAQSPAPHVPPLPVPDTPPSPAQAAPRSPAPSALPSAPDTPLTSDEYRYLQALLYGGDTGWVQAEGLLVSVLTDHINETLYDDFGDTVLDETGSLIEDYIDDLKGMIRP